MNAEEILSALEKIRSVIPQLPQPRPQTSERPIVASVAGEADALADFEYTAVEDALQSMADDLGAALDAAHDKLLAQCLEIYYTAEELSHDPAHADPVTRVEEMRRAYEKSYGTPIPPRGK